MHQIGYYWPSGDDTGHSVCLTLWNEGLLVPRLQTPTAYKLIYGASGLVSEVVTVENVSGLGFVGAIEDFNGDAWLLGYFGDVTFAPGDIDQVAYPISGAVSGDIFAGAAYCGLNPYFAAVDGDLFTISGGAVVRVIPGFGEQVSSISSDGGKLYAALPESSNLAVYSFTNFVTGNVTKIATPMTVPAFVSALDNNSVAGSQNTGANQPVISGPATATAITGASLFISGVLITDTNEPQAGNCTLNLNCTSGTLTTSGSSNISGNGTNAITVIDTFANCLQCAENTVYIAPATAGTDSIAIKLTDQVPVSNTLTIPVTITASSVAVGGWSNSTIVSGASSFGMNGSGNLVVAANAPANRLILIGGAEPDWAISGAVSGTGAPQFAVWASSYEQVLVGDPVNGKVQVFNLQSGNLVPGQVLAVADASVIGVTPDGNTAFVLQPTQNQITVLTNSLNVWSASQVISSLTTPTSVLVLSSSSAVVGSATSGGEVSWLTGNAGTWSLGVSVAVGFTPVGLATNGTGTIFAAGGSGTGQLAAVNTLGKIAPNATWAGNATAVFYEQAQVAVADSTNDLIRVFSLTNPSLVQRATTAAPSGIDAFGYTDPSVWLCGVSGMSQYVFAAPFSLVPQKNGTVSVRTSGTWQTAQLEVGHQPSAAAWDVSGSVWVATLQNDLKQFDSSANLLSSISLQPIHPSKSGVFPSLGISAMIWWNDGLFAVSSQNSAVMEVSGVVPLPVIETAPSIVTGLNISNIGANSLTLSWNKPFAGTPPILYQVQYQRNGAGMWSNFNGLIPATNEIITGLSPNTTYLFQVIATNPVGQSTSAIISATTNAGAPNAPTGLVTSNETTTSINLSWQASTQGTPPISYQPQYRVHGTTAWTLAGNPQGSTATVISGLQPVTDYDLQVVANNGAGSAASIIVIDSTIGIAPSAPTDLTATSATATSVALGWSASTNGTQPITYQPQYKVHGQVLWNNFGSPISGTFVQVTGLTSSTSYDFQIVAVNTTGSAASATLTVSTTAGGTTWNPADETKMTLSGGNLTAQPNGFAAGVRSTTSHSSGQLYVEFTLTTATEWEQVGLANSGWVESSQLGFDKNSVGLTTSGSVFFNGNVIASGMAMTAGNVLCMGFDLSNDLLYIRYNNGAVSSGIAFSGINPGPYFVAFGSTALDGHVAGNQNTGVTNPIIAGPSTVTAIFSKTVMVYGVTLADTIEPTPGNCVLNISCNVGTVHVATGAVTGNGTNSLSVNDTFDTCQAALASLTYTAPATGTTDDINVNLFDQFGSSNTLDIPVTLASTDTISITADFGGSSFDETIFNGFQAWDAAAGTPPNAPTNLTTSNVTGNSVTLTWTASSSGTTPITYQPQYRVHGQNAWNNFGSPLSTTSVIITGLAALTSYDFEIVAENVAGQAASSVVSTTTLSGVPSDPTGVSASRIADLMERFGVNVFPSTSATSNVYGSAGQDYTTGSVEAAINFLVGNSGLIMLGRLWMYQAALGQIDLDAWGSTVAAATGMKYSLVQGGAPGANNNDSIPYSITLTGHSHNGTNGWTGAAQGAIIYVESYNEPNGIGGETAPQTVSGQVELGSSALTGYSEVSICGPSVVIGLPYPENNINPDYLTTAQVDTIVANSKLANGHLYPPSEVDMDDGSTRGGTFNDFQQGLNIAYNGQPQVITEWHPTLDNTAGHASAPLYDAYYAPMFMLSAFRLNYLAYIWYSLFDFGTVYSTGIFPTSGGVNPRPVAYTLQAMYTLTGDPGAAKHTFGPGKIDFTASGLPAPLANTPNTGGQTMLFQNSAGTYFLYVWNAQADPGTTDGPAVNVTITFNSHTMANVTEYNITDTSSATAPKTALQNINNCSSITISLAAAVHLLVITY